MEADKSLLRPTLEEVWGMSGFGTVLIGPALGRSYNLIKSCVHCLQQDFFKNQTSVKTAAYYKM